ncbi:MAG TPA: hypothetical protein DCE80_15735 [Ignavibacteriales bacterium]|nr:hypothetical protein [Ignavibacteriales bacterium]
MFKKVCIAVLLLFLHTSCSDNTDRITELQKQVDSLRSKVENQYTPGFGELMSNVQVHHAKLWFAGINQNWKLADFEIHEIEESLADILKYQSKRDESKSLNVINAPLENVNSAIEKRDLNLFKNTFVKLTNTCNACHEAVKFEFNKVKIPESPPFSNQEFK